MSSGRTVHLPTAEVEPPSEEGDGRRAINASMCGFFQEPDLEGEDLNDKIVILFSRSVHLNLLCLLR